MTSRGTPVNYLHFENSGDHQSKLQKVFKENSIVEYTTPHTPRLNGVIKRILTVIKERASAMLLNEKFNYTDKKILRA